MAPPLSVFAVCVVSVLANVVAPFNLNTQHPVIFRGPAKRIPSDRLSYFGYSVAIAPRADNNSWVVVGAPRANASASRAYNLSETGSVFACRISQPHCREIQFGVTDWIKFSAPDSVEKTGHFWLGGAVTAAARADGKFAVCGHLYPFADATSGNRNGMCYVAKSEWLSQAVESGGGGGDGGDGGGGTDPPKNMVTKHQPLTNRLKQFLGLNANVYLYFSGLYGLSAHFAENGRELAVGAPGVRDGAGAVVYQAPFMGAGAGGGLARRRRRRQSRRTSGEDDGELLPRVGERADRKENDYFGYAVGLGQILASGVTHMAVGAPRANLNRGQVFVVEFEMEPGLPLKLVDQRLGDQLGSYFGGALAVGDISADGWADIVVGAPMWSDFHTGGFENGRVFVYLSETAGAVGGGGGSGGGGDGSGGRASDGKSEGGGRAVAKDPVVLRGDGVTRSRFGSAVAIVGDLDADKINDIIVGAPYEDDSRGAIYIFTGIKDGVAAHYSQKVSAASLDSALLGFGVSLSSATDMDTNGFPDVSVGSYMSDAAVLLRAQPVLRFQATLVSEPQRLLILASSLTLTACLKYYGIGLDTTTDVSITLRVQSTIRSAVFASSSRQNVTYTRTLQRSEYTCDKWRVNLQMADSAADFTEPVWLLMNYSLVSQSSEAADVASTPVYIDSDDATNSTGTAAAAAAAAGGDGAAAAAGDVAERLALFCAQCPVVSPDRAAGGGGGAALRVPYTLGCGDDELCSTRLSVRVQLEGTKGGRLVIGATQPPQLTVIISNGGEPAWLPLVRLELPANLSVTNLPSACIRRTVPATADSPDSPATASAGRLQLTCSLQPSPLTSYDEARLQLLLNTQQLVAGTERLHVLINVSSSGEEQRPQDSVLNYTIGLKTEADIAVQGKTLMEDVFYDKREDRPQAVQNDTNYVYLTHRYHVVRYLMSPIDAVNFTVLVPVNFTADPGSSGSSTGSSGGGGAGESDVVQFLDIYRPVVKVNDGQLHCRLSSGMYLNSDGDAFDSSLIESVVDTSSSGTSSSSSGSQASSAGRYYDNHVRNVSISQLEEQQLQLANPLPQLPDLYYTWLDCSQRQRVQCVRIECPPVAFRSPLATLMLTVRMRLKLHLLEQAVGKYDRFVLSTTGMARLAHQLPYQLQPTAGGHPDVVRVHNLLLPSSLQPLPIWVIVVAVLGALVLLAAITYGLYRTGFFERRRPDDI